MSHKRSRSPAVHHPNLAEWESLNGRVYVSQMYMKAQDQWHASAAAEWPSWHLGHQDMGRRVQDLLNSKALLSTALSLLAP